MNQRMAERLMMKESTLSYKAMRRSIEEYERIKKTMNNNKKALNTTNGATLPSLSLKRTRFVEDRKSRARQSRVN